MRARGASTAIRRVGGPAAVSSACTKRTSQTSPRRTCGPTCRPPRLRTRANTGPSRRSSPRRTWKATRATSRSAPLVFRPARACGSKRTTFPGASRRAAGRWLPKSRAATSWKTAGARSGGPSCPRCSSAGKRHSGPVCRGWAARSGCRSGLSCAGWTWERLHDWRTRCCGTPPTSTATVWGCI